MVQSQLANTNKRGLVLINTFCHLDFQQHRSIPSLIHHAGMGKLLIISFFLVAAVAVETTAFLHSSVSALGKSQGNDYAETNAVVSFFSSSAGLSFSSSDSDSYDGVTFPKSRTDIRNFLTQRSIQSFVFLLNQCREEHTVRFLEKILDFSSIDNFHGTGAFNLTKFPEWDSIFLDCVDRPEEVIVIQMRQRRRQRKLSGHNAYFESLRSPTSTNKAKEEQVTKSSPPSGSFSTTNYLDSMKPIIPSYSSMKVSQKSNITSEKLSGTSNYLNNLGPTPVSAPSLLQSMSLSEKKVPKETKKTVPTLNDDGKKRNTSLDKEDNQNLFQNPKKEPIQRKTFSPGRSTGYLESLSTISNEASSEGNGVGDKKVKQSTEISSNPFLDEKINEVQLSIDPPALVRRILSVREQLSKEWVEDLDILINLNDEITDHFEEYTNEVTAKDEEEDDCDEEDNLKINSYENDTVDKTANKDSNDLDLLLKSLVNPLENVPLPDEFPNSSYNTILESNARQDDPDEENSGRIYDRSIFNTWSQLSYNPKRSSSPYRKANFDLLLLLATQESIHRILSSHKKYDSIRLETQEWLLDFYTDNVNEYFDGHQTHARSEDFLEQMLKSPRTLIETNNDILAWIDPAVVAEDIVRERSDVILEWRKVAETILDEHTDLRRLLFTNMISKSIPEQSLSETILNAVKMETKVDSSTNSRTEIFGAFE